MYAVEDDRTRKSFDLNEKGKSVNQLLRLKTLKERLGVGRSTIYDWMNPCSPRYNPTFPRPIKLSAGQRGAIGWVESDICRWIDSKITVGADLVRRELQ